MKNQNSSRKKCQMKKIRNWTLLGITASFLMSATGCPNAFLESANKTSDDALLFSAEQHANNSEWSAAITDISGMTSDGKAKRETKQALASYYGGRCGLNLLGLAQSLKDNSPSTKLWPIVMRFMVSATAAQLADCKLGEQTILSIDTVPANRNANENVLLAFLEFVKMGAALASSNADANHDGVVDGAFDACSAVDIVDTSVQELGTGLTIMARALAASGFGASGISDLVANLCTTMDAYQAGFCNTTNAADFVPGSAAMKAIRALMKSNEIGFNSCGGSIGSSLACSCP
jgi:hypothetical protein